MKTKCFLLFCMFALFFGCKGNNPSLDIENGNGVKQPKQLKLTEQDKQVLNHNNDFSLKFFNQICADTDENVVCSPMSASALLGLLMNGTDGETFAQIQNTLGFADFNRRQINEYYAKLFEALPALDRTNILRIANSVWVADDFKLEDDFVSIGKEYFDTKIANVNFTKSKTADLINKWASDNTGGHISNIVDKEMIREAVMVLANALYFSGKWESPFDEDYTFEETFHSIKGEQRVDMMRKTDYFLFTETDEIKVLEMPYKEGKFCMDIILPKSEAELKQITPFVCNNDNWNKLIGGLSTYKVHIKMPKYEIHFSKDLNEILQELGIKNIFTSLADFSKLSPMQVLVSLIKQDAYLKVYEAGTEAAAVTIAIGEVTSAGPEPMEEIKEFIANRPFMLAIREKQNGVILFMAQINTLE